MQSSEDLFVLYPVSCLAELKFNTSSCSYSSRMPIVLLWSSLLPVGNHSMLSNESIFIMRMGTCAKSIKKIEFAMSSTGRSRHNLVFFFFLQDDVNECSVILPSLGHGNSLRDIVQ